MQHLFFSGLDRVRRCLEPQILQSQIISLHHRIAIHRKQHDRDGIFGHCDEDVGKNLTWEVLRHVSILGVPPLNHVSRWSSRLQTRPKGQSHLSNSENRMVVICRDWTNVSAEWFWRLAKDTDSILKHWVEQIRWIQRLGARLFNRLFTCKIHSPAALNRSWPGQRWATLVARRAVALAWGIHGKCTITEKFDKQRSRGSIWKDFLDPKNWQEQLALILCFQSSDSICLSLIDVCSFCFVSSQGLQIPKPFKESLAKCLAKQQPTACFGGISSTLPCQGHRNAKEAYRESCSCRV